MKRSKVKKTGGLAKYHQYLIPSSIGGLIAFVASASFLLGVIVFGGVWFGSWFGKKVLKKG